MERTSSKKTSSKTKGDSSVSGTGGGKGDKGDKGRLPKSEIISKYKGLFNEECISAMLYTHGDPKDLAPDPVTLDLLDDILLEFLYDTAHHAHRHAAAKSRIKVDDLRVSFRHDPILLGRLEEIIEKEKKIERDRKAANASTDVSALALLAEEFGALDDGGPGGPTAAAGDDDEEQLNRLLGSFTGQGLDGGMGLDMLLGGTGMRGPSGFAKEDEEVDLSGASAGGKRRKRKSAADDKGQGKKSRTASPAKSSASEGKPSSSVAEEANDDVDDDDVMEEVQARAPALPLDPALAAILGGF